MVISKEMNLSEFRKVFTEEFNFISGAFSRCQWPKPVESEDESESDENEAEDATTDEEDVDKNTSAEKIKSGPGKMKNLKDGQNRAGTIKELLQKQEEIRSKEKENRKRKKEEPKKSKHKDKKKKKKKNSDENTTKPSIKTEPSNKANTSKVPTSNSETKPKQKEETKDMKPIVKTTRARIKHGADVIVNESASMLFSKLAFSDSVDELKPKVGGPKQPKHVLGKLEKMNSLISSLEERGKKEKAQRLKENMSWSNAFFRAEGAKVKDNTNKVKHSVKQLAKRKRVSERKWKKRLGDIETKKEKKASKRETHIQKRIDQKKERKLKKLIKRGRFIPDLKTKPE